MVRSTDVRLRLIHNILAQTANATRFSVVTFEPEEIRTRNFGFSGSTQLSLCPYTP